METSRDRFAEMAEIYDRIDNGTATPEDLEIACQDDLDPNGYVQTLLASPLAGGFEESQEVESGKRGIIEKARRLVRRLLGQEERGE